MLKLTDPKAELVFIPSFEKDADKPTTFFIRPADVRDANYMKTLKASRKIEGGEVEIRFSDDDRDWLGYLAARIIRIENVEREGVAATIIDKEEIKATLLRLPNGRQLGSELYAFLEDSARLRESDIKN